jgi:hypothetical protein
MAQPEEQPVQAEEAVKEDVVEEVPAVVEEEPKQQDEEKKEEDKEEEKKEKEKKEEPKEVVEQEPEKSKEELLDMIKQYKKQIDDLLEDVKYLRAKLDKERGVKESLEVQLLQLQRVNKMHLAEQVCDLRKELGLKEEAMDDLMMLSEESLNSSIKTFMEFKESTVFNVNKLPKVQSNAIVSEEQDNTSKEITESVNSQNASNIDYEQEIDDWFKKMTNRKYF